MLKNLHQLAVQYPAPAFFKGGDMVVSSLLLRACANWTLVRRQTGPAEKKVTRLLFKNQLRGGRTAEGTLGVVRKTCRGRGGALLVKGSFADSAKPFVLFPERIAAKPRSRG